MKKLFQGKYPRECFLVNVHNANLKRVSTSNIYSVLLLNRLRRQKLDMHLTRILHV